MTLLPDIAEIAARDKQIAEGWFQEVPSRAIGHAFVDRRALLRAYRELAETAERRFAEAAEEISRRGEEIDRLRASNEKLQRALRDIYKSDCPDSLALEDWQGLTLKLQRKAMAALADAQHPEQHPDSDAQTK